MLGYKYVDRNLTFIVKNLNRKFFNSNIIDMIDYKSSTNIKHFC